MNKKFKEICIALSLTILVTFLLCAGMYAFAPWDKNVHETSIKINKMK